MTPDGILETVMYADDLAAAKRFYGEILGLELYSEEPGRHVFFRCGGQMLLLFDPAVTGTPTPGSHLPVPPHGSHGPGHVCFRTERQDIEHWRTHLQETGVDIESDFEWPQGGRSIYFRDPAGNSLEFAEPRIWGLT